MKKIFTLLLVALIGLGSSMAYADNSSKEQKQWTKNAEMMAQKQKWLKPVLVKSYSELT